MSSPETSTPDDDEVRGARPPRRWRRRALIGGQILIGLALGLVAAEYAFHQRDGGAFPHVNFYVEDPSLGVRLAPGASMRSTPRHSMPA